MDTNRIFKDMNKAQIYTHTKKYYLNLWFSQLDQSNSAKIG